MSLRDIILNLRRPSAEGELSSIDIETKYQSGVVVISLDYYGALHCLFEVSAEIRLERISNGFTVRSRALQDLTNGSERIFLDLCWSNPFESRLFEAVVEEISELKIHENELLPEIRRKVKKWDFLLSSVSDPLTKIESIGLFGELLILKWILDNKFSRTLSCWTGPLGMPHDFELSNFSLEVKTSIADNSLVNINNLDQLTNFDNKLLYLVKINIFESDDGQTITELAKNIDSVRSNQNDLFQYLSMLTNDYTNQEFLNINYKIKHIQIYKVDSDFPRITRSELSQLPNNHAIRKLQYSLDLSAISPISTVSSIDEFIL